MATICREARLPVGADKVWDVIRDVGAVHTRLAPGFVVDTVLEEGARVVTFANGMVVREIIVSVDPVARRLVYSARSERLTHHNASFQVFPEPDGCRLVWIADLLPDSASEVIGAMMTNGLVAVQAALEKMAATID